MLYFLRGKVGNRKLRLFAVACCRRIWPLLADERSRRAVSLCELYAEGLTTKAALVAARNEAGRVARPLETSAVSGQRNRALAAAMAARYAARPTDQPSALADDTRKAANAALTADTIGRLSRRIRSECILPQCELLREIVGTVPYRPLALDPAWLTPTRRQPGRSRRRRRRRSSGRVGGV